MVILGIDSAAKTSSAAVVEDGKLLSEEYLDTGLTHSVTLLSAVKSCMSKAGVECRDLDAVAVAAGPGSFTGVRIGIAAAKGIAQPFSTPCFPVSTLLETAYPLGLIDGIAVSLMDARRDQFYCAFFDISGESPKRLSQDCAMSIEELNVFLEKVDKKKILIGDGAKLVFDKLSEKIKDLFLAKGPIRYQRASWCAFSAWERRDDNNAFVAPNTLKPVYLRPPQAERNLNKK